MAFCGYFCVRFDLLFGVVFGAVFRLVFYLFWPRAKNAEDEIRYTFHAKTWFFKVRARAAAAPRTTTNRSKIIKQRLQKV